MDVYGMGAAAADFDNDGWQDLLVTAVGQNRLFRNTGTGTFVDVTAQGRPRTRVGFSTSAMWFDYDRDGYLDLLVCNYVRWTPDTDVRCSIDGKQKAYCTPEAYRGATSWLFRNRGNGTFEDVTAKAGMFDATSKSLGVTLVEYDADPWPDVFIANDTQPNKLYRNNGNGTFTELGLKAGLALSEEGRARAGMGVDAADVDNSGTTTVVITNFSGEMLGLYRPGRRRAVPGRGAAVGGGPRDATDARVRLLLLRRRSRRPAGPAGGQRPHRRHVHPRRTAASRTPSRPHLFHNRGRGQFTDIVTSIGGAFAQPKVGRGAAFADIDGDLDLDVVITTNGGPAALYRNDSPPGNRALRLHAARGDLEPRRHRRARPRLRRPRSLRAHGEDRIELPVAVRTAAHLRPWHCRRRPTASSIEWPSGKTDELKDVAAGKAYTVVEGKGLAP